MAPRKKMTSPIEFIKGANSSIDIDFDQFSESEDLEMPVTKADRVLGVLGSGGLPLLTSVVGEGDLVPVLTAIDPTLKLSDIDDACSKLEDLAILLLTTVRANRHQIKDDIAGTNAGMLASHVYGEQATELMDSLAELDIMDEDEIENSRKLLQSTITGGKRKTSRS